MDAQWQRCIELFLQSIYDRSGSMDSLISYRSILKRFFADPARSPADYTRTDVLEFLQVPSVGQRTPGQPVSASTKNQRLSALSAFYTFASLYEVDGVPLYQKPLPTRGIRQLKRDRPYRAMSADELQRFFAAIPTDTRAGLRARALFLTYFWTARRRTEISNLYWRDIEPAIIVDQESGTSRAGYIYRYRAKGTSRVVRTAELPLPAWNAIVAYLKGVGRLATIKPDEPIFLSSHRRNMPLHDDYVNMLFKDICRKADLPVERLSLHSLRHAAALARYRAGEKIHSIQRLLGHASLATTDIYLQGLAGIDDPGAQLLLERFGSL